MKCWLCLIIFICLFTSIAIGQDSRQNGYIPKNGFIPDERTAVAIAEAILIPIYGKEQIDSERPLIAKLKNDIWTVTGSLPKGHDMGGVAEVRLSKRNARVIFVEHTK
jgi:hypothetical protein